jgi:N-acetylneuraminic acid mutarotase
MDVPFTTSLYGNATSNGKKIYVYTATADNNFWEFDPLSNQWEQKKSFPGEPRGGSTHFSIGGEIYVGLGAENVNWDKGKHIDFYKYSPATDTWTRVADFTHEPFRNRYVTSTFTINNIAYFGHGSSYSDNKTFWSYHPATDEWRQISDCPVAANFTTGFALGGYGYVTGEMGVDELTWKYDPVLDKWEQSHSMIKPRASHFSFTLNGKAYIGGGVDGYYFDDNEYKELWEFIP